ncbi:unnamed protein product [Nesidiocoris tenuis]|uniref:Uncharacterized protein n=1 Tax=Nesidiocoris tenuis TaxID=355587 RepID=A0A6H5G1K2_9HEMI|nr:unnamed protein product [Nesidiocoris tenuis]
MTRPTIRTSTDDDSARSCDSGKIVSEPTIYSFFNFVRIIIMKKQLFLIEIHGKLTYLAQGHVLESIKNAIYYKNSCLLFCLSRKSSCSKHLRRRTVVRAAITNSRNPPCLPAGAKIRRNNGARQRPPIKNTPGEAADSPIRRELFGAQFSDAAIIDGKLKASTSKTRSSGAGETARIRKVPEIVKSRRSVESGRTGRAARYRGAESAEIQSAEAERF